MRQLTLRALGLGAAVALSCAAAFATLPVNEDGFLAAVVDKHRIIRATRGPKIVVIGGSNAAFGVDSRCVEEHFGRPTINLGLHAGLGLRYMLGEVKPYVQRGDVIVVSPEYAQFYGMLDGEVTLPDMAAIYPRAFASFSSVGQALTLSRSFSDHVSGRVALLGARLKGQSAAIQDPVYFRRGFNRRGDLESHLGRPAQDISALSLVAAEADTSAFDERAIAELNRFQRFAREHGATAVLVLPRIPDAHYRRQARLIDFAHRRLRAESGMLVAADLSSTILPGSSFYDTPYHLTAEGRARNTDAIIRAIRSAGVSVAARGDAGSCRPGHITP
ncbi:MAG: hypothetical protein ICV87_10060 [Gemmatimonadetes bacterium]|nr:hypothetical protein [Gemmatimonadota bacterium]